MLEFNGHFDGKVITPDANLDLPVGTTLRVSVEPLDDAGADPLVWNRLLALADECAVDGPPDLAERHDHYAHGKPLE